ncbi:MAG: hypothetical protein WCO18_01700 [bacterium]
MKKDLKLKNNSSKGFTLLFASMIAGLLLAIGAAILSITVKQVSLSAAGRESQFAFYNADTGTECALYLYRVSRTNQISTTDLCPAGLFPEKNDTTSNDPSCASANSPTIYKCLGSSLTTLGGAQITDFSGSVATGVYSFSIASSTPNICFDVTVDKSDTVNHTTKIISRGYNTCSTVNRFGRAIEVDF